MATNLGVRASFSTNEKPTRNKTSTIIKNYLQSIVCRRSMEEMKLSVFVCVKLFVYMHIVTHYNTPNFSLNAI